MLALFSIVVHPDGSVTQSNGSLYQLPPELCDQYRIKQYLGILSEGWSVSEFGYLSYHRKTQAGVRYIFPGLYLTDGPKPSKKIYGYKPMLSKKDIEVYVQEHIDRNNTVRNQAEQEMTALVHDLRHLSTAIYHSAEQAERAARESDRAELFDSLKTIVATQTMLSARIDYLDYASGVDRFDSDAEISVFSRVDKVVRCFSASAQDKNVQLRLSGQSFRFAKGPNILDIVPYTLVDNAIKYSPPNYDVNVSVYDTGTDTVVSISSIGPDIVASERDLIFDRSFRGSNAVKLRPSGTGLGLAVASEIVGKFDGTLTVTCSGEQSSVDGVPHRSVEFRFTVPSYGEDTKRMKRYNAGRARRARRA
jgi:signal transduction histidine kinase